MIYAEKPNAEEKDFLTLLENSKGLMLIFLSGKKNISSTYFETVVCEKMIEAAKGTGFEGTIKQTGTYKFPDIIAKQFFGVEVKMTVKDHWTSTGNSVLESSRIEDAERIYIMFGKFGGNLDIRYRLYQECLPEISVTHSPRYRINMDLPEGKSIFDKIGTDYDALRKDHNAIKKIKDYYRSQLKEGEELWWIDQEDEDRSVSPIIKPYRSLSDKEKENFVVEAMILFPEMFGNSSTKFERAAAYLISEYNAVSANLRDLFTAGGQVKVKVKDKLVLGPQLAFRLQSRAKAIDKKIDVIEAEKLKYYWRTNKLKKPRLDHWKKLLDKEFSLTMPSVLASAIFDAGLK